MISGVSGVKWVLLGKKVRLVGQFEILAKDNFFSSKVRLVGQFFLRFCPTGRTPVYNPARVESNPNESFIYYFKWLILFAFLFSTPRLFWNWKQGNILTSYVKYTKTLISIIRTKMENVPNEGYYGGSDVPLCAAFDGESKMFSKKSKYEKIVRSDFTIKREVSPDAIDPDFVFNTNNNSKNGTNAANGENSGLLGRVTRKFLKRDIQWGGGITGHQLFTPVMTHKIEVCIFKIY